MLKRLMHNLEHRLARRTSNRTARPFEWGTEFIDRDGFGGGNGKSNGEQPSELESIIEYNHRAIAESESFFGDVGVEDYSLDGCWLSFPSPVRTPYEENNTVYARYFPVAARGRAVLVLPQWNGDIESHAGLCRVLNRAGIAALRLSLPYHDRRMLKGFERADYMVSANIGRTLQAVRQAVLDARAAIDWLAARGYDRVGIIGTSIGSCVSFLTFVHDERLRAGAFNLVSSYFGDVVWGGMATAHVRRSLETALTRDEVRQAWLAISPNSYIKRLARNPRRGLFVSARYDLTFTPELSRLLFDECDRHGIKFDRRHLPWGHYTMGEAPFKYYDGYLLVKYLRKHL
jgi:pimeloyl-ACP methyl ester carboxylesterase